jgi:CheY-like chemotaxis protein
MAKILVVDDECMIPALLLECLKRYGHTVKLARSTVGALGWLCLEEFELAILDAMMEGPMDGLGLCRMIRNTPLKTPAKVLVISSDPDMKEKALTAGADAFLPKPFDLLEITSCVTKLIDLGRGVSCQPQNPSVEETILQYLN